MEVQLGNVIAERHLKFSPDSSAPRNVRVLVGAPLQSPGMTAWYCPFQIIGLGSEEVHTAYGADSVQALQLALRLIGATLHSRVHHPRHLSWFDNEPGDHGFPFE